MTVETLEELRQRLLRQERVQEMVRARAYEIFELRGGQPGWEAHDWLQAEGEVLAFLIVHESRREDEKSAAETPNAASAPEAPATKESRPRAPSKSAGAKQATPKKTAAKRAAPKKAQSKPKAKPTRKSSTKKESDQ